MNPRFDRVFALIILLTMLAIALSSAHASSGQTVVFRVQTTSKDGAGYIVTMQPILPVNIVAVPVTKLPQDGDVMKCTVSDALVGYMKDPQHPDQTATGSFQQLDCGRGVRMIVKGVQYSSE